MLLSMISHCLINSLVSDKKPTFLSTLSLKICKFVSSFRVGNTNFSRNLKVKDDNTAD